MCTTSTTSTTRVLLVPLVLLVLLILLLLLILEVLAVLILTIKQMHRPEIEHYLFKYFRIFLYISEYFKMFLYFPHISIYFRIFLHVVAFRFPYISAYFHTSNYSTVCVPLHMFIIIISIVLLVLLVQLLYCIKEQNYYIVLLLRTEWSIRLRLMESERCLTTLAMMMVAIEPCCVMQRHAVLRLNMCAMTPPFACSSHHQSCFGIRYVLIDSHAHTTGWP
jgi:hypothetical protein